MQGKHKHKCEKCGYVWEHDDLCALSTHEEFVRAHTCQCGTEQTMKYHGTEAGEYRACASLPVNGNGQVEMGLRNFLELLGIGGTNA